MLEQLQDHVLIIMRNLYLYSVAALSLCHSGRLTEDLPTDAPRLALIQSLLSPSLLVPTLTPQAGPDPVRDPDPKADQGVLISLINFTCELHIRLNLFYQVKITGAVFSLLSLFFMDKMEM